MRAFARRRVAARSAAIYCAGDQVEVPSRRARHAIPRGHTLVLVGGWLICGIVTGGCDSSGARVERTSPSTTPSAVPAAPSTSLVVPSGSPTSALVPSESPSPGATWGPLAVVPPQDGADTARTEGTLRITDACVFLVTRGGPVLLVWPADRTTWNTQARTIAFANFDGRTVTFGDGTRVVVGGSGDSNSDSGTTTEAWLARTPWVARPAPSCPSESWWWVGALTR